MPYRSLTLPIWETPPVSSSAQTLGIYNYYRFAISLILLVLFLMGLQLPLGSSYPQLYLGCAIAYCSLNTLSILIKNTKKISASEYALALIVIDLVMLTLLMHASGGPTNTYFGMLMLVTVAAGSILIEGQISLLIAAIATIAVIYEQFYFSLVDFLSYNVLTQAGLLGIAFFAIAIFVQQVSNLLRASEKLSTERANAILELQKLNHYTIQRVPIGTLVVDYQNKIKLINSAAIKLLDINPQQNSVLTLSKVPRLQVLLNCWRSGQTLQPFKVSATSPELSASFTKLGEQSEADVLIFVENLSKLMQQAQQLKLASLGQLTASIAHEIRNPLGAISHATQLLLESNQADADKHFLSIIQHQSKRMNTIIENVLQLSRPDAVKPIPIELNTWLKHYIEEFSYSFPRATIHLVPDENLIHVSFDPDQLKQVLTNLIENGLRYSLQQTAREEITLKTATTNQHVPYLEVQDKGPGISPKIIEHLFEPFYTTEARGTGLGLYLAKALCEANQANLNYITTFKSGGCFRISFTPVNITASIFL